MMISLRPEDDKFELILAIRGCEICSMTTGESLILRKLASRSLRVEALNLKGLRKVLNFGCCSRQLIGCIREICLVPRKHAISFGKTVLLNDELRLETLIFIFGRLPKLTDDVKHKPGI
jgi:hypothetical protein